MSSPEDSAAVAASLQREVLQPLKETFVGKDEIIDLLGISLAAGEHLFILGPPGTAKSALVHELARRLHGQSFEYLLTRFTEPNEIFGPFDIRKLREGVLEANTEGMLPEASLVFLDELFNANSAILNSLLTVLNERILRRGREEIQLPLLMAVGASNELPEEDSLRALFDRFLLRVRCDNVPEDALAAVLAAGWKLEARDDNDAVNLGLEDVRRLHQRIPEVDVQSIRPDYLRTISRIRRAGLSLSDRRAVKLQRLIAASALICGRTQAIVSDLWPLRYIWESDEQQEVLRAIVEEALATQAESPSQPAPGSIHPRGRDQEPPDPEHLASDLEQLMQKLDGAGGQNEELSLVRDRLSMLASRSQWVTNQEQRAALQERIDALWRELETADA